MPLGTPSEEFNASIKKELQLTPVVTLSRVRKIIIQTQSAVCVEPN